MENMELEETGNYMEEKSCEEILKERVRSISPADDGARRAARERWDSLAKPVDGLGRFEDMVVDIAGARGSAAVRLRKKAVAVMCGDHGVVEEGVSQTDRSVTVNVANAIAGGTSTINVMAASAGADVFAVDMGMAAGRESLDERIIDMNVKPGTGNIAAGPAMTREEACRAVLYGMDMAAMLAERGYDIAVSGEMGIGNTTPMTAITCALSGAEPSEITGRGAGLSDEGLERKIRAVESALRVNCPDPSDAVDVLSKVGGLEIAGMAGLFLGGAECGMPVIADVSVSSAAAVIAAMICPAASGYMIMSCVGKEPAAAVLAEMLGKKPVIDADMALGEGTSAVMLYPLLDMALSVYNNGRTFDDADITAYERF